MATFKIGFDGPAVDNGEIDVAELAPALLALGEVFTTANQALNHDRADAKLKIRASERGSFVALLSLDVSFITDMLDVVSAHPSRITAAKDLLDLLLKGGSILTGTALGTVGLFHALKFLKGKKPDSSSRNEDGTTSITVNHTTIIVDQRTATLLEDVPTRTATQKFANTALKAPGIRSVNFVEAPKEEESASGISIELTKGDLGAMQLPEPTDEETTTSTHTREAFLKIVSAQFAEGYLWRFTDGNNTFTASMDDRSFTDKLDRSEIVLSKDDTLRCQLEEVQQLAGSRLKTETKIVEVIEHISGARQLKLFD